MIRSAIAVVVGLLLLGGCGGDQGAEEAEGTVEEMDTTAMAAEGGAAPADDPSMVPIEVSYSARLLLPKTEATAAGLPPGGDFSASGTGTCQVDEGQGTWRVTLIDIDKGNLGSFQMTRWKPQDKPPVTNVISAGKGDLEIFNVANDGKDFLDKAVMSAKRASDGATIEFDAETSLGAYALKGTARCARLSPTTP